MKKNEKDCRTREDIQLECRLKAIFAQALRDPELRKMFTEDDGKDRQNRKVKVMRG